MRDSMRTGKAGRLDYQNKSKSSKSSRHNCLAPSSWGGTLSLIVIVVLIPVLILATLLPTHLLHSWTPWGYLYGKDNGTKQSSNQQGKPLEQAAGSPQVGDQYLLGVGKADITGPCVEINMMGYANPEQIGTGLRQRLYSRAFIVGKAEGGADRTVYLVLDTQSGDTAVRYGILSGLRDLGPEYAYYGHHNLALTGTHSHSGPGAWLNYLLPQITSKGFNQQSYRAIVDGAILSIRRAHESLAPGYLSVGTTKVWGANINRSLFAYLANPLEERARYNVSSEDDGSVDKDLTLLNFQRASDNKNIGVLTWFATHGTSVLGNNTLISGDNKGVAAKLFEDSVGDDEMSAEGFVAAFSQASVGDASPNVLGAWCEDGSGQRCSFENSTCTDGRSQMCHGRGPFFRIKDEGTSSCYEVGKRQFEPARDLYRQPDKLTAIRGGWVKSYHTFHDMSQHEFPLENGTRVSTCPAALGYSFAAGTTDWPGDFDFTQHDGGPGTTSPVWQVVSGMLKAPSAEQKACHSPKPILLDVGEMSRPYLWTPNIVDMQAFRVGQLVMIISSGEATTMAGRRWKEAVARDLSARFPAQADATPPVVVLGGPANSYSHYVTTEEEYGVQRYEGASTLYGPHTLAAYIHKTLELVSYLDSSSTTLPPAGPQPPDNSNRSLSFVPGVLYDTAPMFDSFGQVTTDVASSYRRGTPATATFVGANPRNDLRLEGSYAAVEKLVVPGRGPERRWEVVRDDGDWHLVFRWRRTSPLLGTSEVAITWETEDWAEPGTYRIRYFGHAKSSWGAVREFDGTSAEFALTAHPASS